MFHFFIRHLWLIVAGGGAGVAGRYVQLRLRNTHRLILPDPQIDLLHLHQQFGYNSHSLVGIGPGVRLWSNPAGGIGYNEFRKVWLVPGDPLASEDNLFAVTDSFLRKAREERRVVGFLPASEQFATHSRRLGLRAVKVGSAPYFDLATWAPRGDRAKKARAGVNQARRSGVRVAEVAEIDEQLIRETAFLCKSWLATRRSAMKFGWLFSVDLFEHRERKKYFTARDADGRLVGFLAASSIPARDGWYLEDILRTKDAPNGTTDLLVVEVLELLRQTGAKLATLGTAPMCMEGLVDKSIPISPALSRMTRSVLGCFSAFYNFEGVRRFKSKFAPSWWESEYLLVTPNATAPLRVMSAVVHAIVPAGPSTLIVRQATRAWRRMNAVKDAATKSSRNDQTLGAGEVQSPDYPLQSVSVDGVKLNYVTAGSGRPVVLIHGNPGSHQDYSEALIDKLSQSYYVIAFDRPGHGNSERNGFGDTTVEEQARLLRDALQALSIKKPVLVGHSWGGSLVLAAALEYEKEFSGIVLLAPAAYPSVNVEWWSQIPNLPVVGNLMVHRLTPILGGTIVKQSLKDAYHPQVMPRAYAERSARMWTRPSQLTACASDERTLRASLESLSKRYGEIELPAIIVTGDCDRLLEPKEHAFRLSKELKRSSLVVLPDTGHQLPQTRPDAVVEAIEVAWAESFEKSR